MAEPAEIIGQKNSHFIGATDGVYVCVCVCVCTIGVSRSYLVVPPNRELCHLRESRNTLRL